MMDVSEDAIWCKREMMQHTAFAGQEKYLISRINYIE